MVVTEDLLLQVNPGSQTFQFDAIMVQEHEVPNLNVDEYNMRANELLAQKIAPYHEQLPVSIDEMPVFIQKIQEETMQEVYQQMMMEQQ